MKPRSIRCMKLFLTLFNIICILFGLVLMAVCVINMRDRKSRPDHSGLSRGVLSFLLTLGFGLVVTAVLGCVGALRENVKILYVPSDIFREDGKKADGLALIPWERDKALVWDAACVDTLAVSHLRETLVMAAAASEAAEHACFFIFLVSLEVVVAVGGAVLSAWMGGGSELRVHFPKNTTVEDTNQAFWDHIQSENQCCGVDGPQDYELVHREIPSSCCASTHSLREGGARRHMHANCLTEKSYYMRGCDEALRLRKAFKGNVFIITGVTFILIEILCIILAIWMARTIKTERKRLQQNLQAHFES